MSRTSIKKYRAETGGISASVVSLVAAILAAGGVGVLPTYTIYGIVGSALNKKVVERIYHLRERDTKKPMIILIGSLADLAFFGVVLDKKELALARRVWPGKVSVVMPCPTARFSYLHRGSKTLAFRMPEPQWLRALLKITGPLVAPSANVEGESPAKTVAGAKRYFGDKIEFYGDAGKRVSRPSTIIKMENGKIMVLRKGAVAI